MLRLPLYFPHMARPLLPTERVITTVTEEEDRLGHLLHVSRLDNPGSRAGRILGAMLHPAAAPPALPLVGGFPQVGVVAHVTSHGDVIFIEGLQRFAVIDVEPDAIHAHVQLIGDAEYMDDGSGAVFEACLRALPPAVHEKYPALAQALRDHAPSHYAHALLRRDVYALCCDLMAKGRVDDSDTDVVVNASVNVSQQDYTQCRELFGFALAAAVHDLTVPERLALLLADNGMARVEWLLKRKLSPA